MNDVTGRDLRQEPGSVKARKKPAELAVSFAREQGILATLEGDVRFEPGDAIVTGNQGERWPVRRERFFRTYTPKPPLLPGEDGWYTATPLDVRALRLQQGGHIRIIGGVLRGEAGDWLVQYGPDDYGIVSGALFAEKYEILHEEANG